MTAVLGLIPARGGSKRLPRKNLADLGGRSLIAWTIAAGLGARCIDELAVSTDDARIADEARACGAKLPFLRPAEIAGDTASSMAVVRHALDHYAAQGRTFEFVVLLQPTSPFRRAADIDAAFGLLTERGADAVVSVCEVDHSPLWSNTLPADRSMKGFLRDEVKGRRSQDLPTYYRLNGAIYLCRVDRLLAEDSFFLSDNIYAYEMPKSTSIDIDDATDLAIARALCPDWAGDQP